MMRAFCATVDASGGTAYLETDKEINVSFYQRHGFSVVEGLPVIALPNWLILRSGN